METAEDRVHRTLARLQVKFEVLDDAQAYAQAQLHNARTDREGGRWRTGTGSTAARR